jgi:hypothetical protein
MGDPNAAPVPDPPGDDVPRPSGAADEPSWTDEWAERQWNDIVADLTGPTTDQGAATDQGGAATDPGPRGQGSETAGGLPPSIAVAPWLNEPGPAARAPGPRDWPTTPEGEALEDEDAHFVPPEPDHILGRDPLTNLAWALAVVAPILVLVLLITVHPFPRLVGGIACGAFLVGVGLLVWRMPRDRDDHDGPGAVV